MKKIITLFFILFLCQHESNARTSSPISDFDLFDLYGIALKNINFSSSISEDSIINICIDLEAQHRQQENQDTLFGISEIEVNALCLKGNMGLALNKAKQMYEDAKTKKNQLGIGLAFQAIGETYLHSNQYQKADESFKEAAKIIDETHIVYAKLRLLIQQMYVCMELNDMPQLQKHLFETIAIAERIDREEYKNDLNFYILCYQTLYEIGVGENGLAHEHLKKALAIQFPHRLYDVWKYYINSRYYELTTDYKQALLYSDSLLACLNQKNPNAYIKFAQQRADLYEKCQEPEKACDIYVQINNLSDSLNARQYTAQIDSLHTMYWIDQMKVENAVSYNQMLTKAIGYGIILLIIIVVFISLAKKKNKQLKESQIKLSLAREEAASSIQSKSLFLSNMSHELRTPLNAIVSFSSLLVDNEGTDQALKQQCAEIIRQNSYLLQKLINDIVDISELKENKIKFVWAQCDAAALCQSVINTIEKVKQTQATLHYHTEVDHLLIDTDQERLQQVLINLLINATKFTPKGSITLQLKLSEKKDMAIFIVEDTGCGIPLEKQPNIFKRYEKLHESVQGSGLGLAICQLIIDYVGGEIKIDPSYTQGARFIFTHPINRVTHEEPKNA